MKAFAVFLVLALALVFSLPYHLYLKQLAKKDQAKSWKKARKYVAGFFKAELDVSGAKTTVLGKENEAKKYLDLSFHFVTFLTLAMAFGLAAVSRKFAILFWGPSFEVSGKLIAILAISMIFIAWPNIIRAQYLIPAHKEKEYIFSVVMGAVVNFVVNLFFIKEHMAVGTASINAEL